LVQEEYPSENRAFLEAVGIQFFQFPIPANKEPFVVIPDASVISALEIILDKRNHPILVHCNAGKHRTGCIMGIFRRLQGWALTPVLAEYRRYASPKQRVMDQMFIELFDVGKNLSGRIQEQNLEERWAIRMDDFIESESEDSDGS
jgi:tyrosine-protein phosphatase SIW14